MLVTDLVTAGGAAGAILNHGGGAPFLIVVLRGRQRGRYGARDKLKGRQRGDTRDLAPASAMTSRQNRARASHASRGAWRAPRATGKPGGRRVRVRSGGDQETLPGSVHVLASPARRVSTAPPPCSMAFLAGAGGLLGRNGAAPRALSCVPFFLRMQ